MFDCSVNFLFLDVYNHTDIWLFKKALANFKVLKFIFESSHELLIVNNGLASFLLC